MIDLRSDTLSVPTSEIYQAIKRASVSDHGYYEDKSTLKLEKYCAELFGKEDSLFMVSGTMSNQIALRCHTVSGDEVISDVSYHLNNFESGAAADLGKISLNLCCTQDGIITPRLLKGIIESKVYSSIVNSPKLLWLENTINTHGGKIYPLHILKKVYLLAKTYGLAVHIDGARILNACVSTGITPAEYGMFCDSISVCFSKGLGAPFGSVLIADSNVISQAQKYKKWYGGGMHQSGLLAEPCLYAIKNNTLQLKIDHNHASLLARILHSTLPNLVDPDKVETNIVMLNLKRFSIESKTFVTALRERGVLLYLWDKWQVRAVMCKNICEGDVKKAARIILSYLREHGFC